MNAPRHLTEAERHDAADGSLTPDQHADVQEHLAQCEACAGDVARVRELMTHVHDSQALDAARPADDLWPEIRARIERDKIVQLPASEAAPPSGRFTRRVRWLAAGLAAAVMLLLALPPTRGKGKALPAATVEVQLAADSARAFEREATTLLNELELRRAMLRPQQRSAIDRDLKVIDDAIVELKDAIARDPNNASLRRLLASSYRQKVDVLKRVGGSG